MLVLRYVSHIMTSSSCNIGMVIGTSSDIVKSKDNEYSAPSIMSDSMTHQLFNESAVR